MKRLIIACILILALANQAYAMGSHGGGGRSANVSSSGSGGSSAAGSNSSTTNTTPTGTTNTPNNSTAGGNTGAPGGQGFAQAGPIIVVSPSTNESCNNPIQTPELTTMVLLGSALLGLWGVRRKIKR